MTAPKPDINSRTHTLHRIPLPSDRTIASCWQNRKKHREPHVVRYWKYKPCMVHLRSRLAAFIRQRRGNTPQRVFARKMGVAQSTIMRIENEEQNVTLQTLEQLCKAFHVDIADLFPAADTIRVYRAPVRTGQAAMIHEKNVDDEAGDADSASGESK